MPNKNREAPVTVGELIEHLQTLDPNLRVFVSGYEGGYHDVGKPTEPDEFALNINRAWYYGPHESVNSYDRYEDAVKVRGIVL